MRLSSELGVEYRHGAVGRSAYPFYLLPQTVRRLVRYRYLVDGAEGKSLDGFCRSGGPSAGCEQNGGPDCQRVSPSDVVPVPFAALSRCLSCLHGIRSFFSRSVRCVGGGLTPLFLPAVEDAVFRRA